MTSYNTMDLITIHKRHASFLRKAIHKLILCSLFGLCRKCARKATSIAQKRWACKVSFFCVCRKSYTSKGFQRQLIFNSE